MKIRSTAALRAAILCTAAITVSACAYDRSADRDEGYRGTAYHADDPCTHDNSYCSYPTYEGSIDVDGNWYDGRYRYRDSDHGREYWFNNGWHSAEQTRDGHHDSDRGDHDSGPQHDHDHGGD